MTASYDDGERIGKTKSEEVPYAVLGALENNSAPAFPAATAERSVDENSPRGTAVGAPVTATDPDLERAGGPNRKVTYWLGGTGGEDNDLFTVDAETGQIRVKTSQDYETPQGGRVNDSTDYTVSVMATDSSNVDTATPLVVTISLVDVDDAPVITLTAAGRLRQRLRRPESSMKAASQSRGRKATPLTSGSPALRWRNDDGGTPALSLSGADASLFRIGAFVPTDAIPTYRRKLRNTVLPLCPGL